MQDDLRIFGIILVPRIKQRFARSMRSNRRYELHVMAAAEQEVRERPVIIAGWLERHFTPRRSQFKLISKFVEIRQCISDAQGGPFPVR